MSYSGTAEVVAVIISYESSVLSPQAKRWWREPVGAVTWQTTQSQM